MYITFYNTQLAVPNAFLMGFGEEAHKGEVPFSTVMSRVHAITVKYDDVNLDHFAKVCGSDCCLAPYISCCPLWKQVTKYNPHLRGAELCSTSLAGSVIAILRCMDIPQLNSPNPY